MEFDQNIFFDEFNNKIISLENALIDLKQGNYGIEVINEMFRAIHTIKSTSDLLGMFSLVDVSHKAEDVLDAVRNNKFSMDQKLCSLFIEFKDYIALSIQNISLGIFDDEVTQTLTIYFEKEFTHYLHRGEKEKLEDLKTILVVEDSTLVRYTIKKIAVENNYNVFITNNGEDGYKKLLNHEIDIILCDLSTPNIGVEEMIKNIKQNIQYDQIPIVMLVTHLNKPLVDYGKEMQIQAWLNKPIQSEKLLVILNKIL